MHGELIDLSDLRVGKQVTDFLVMKSRTDKLDENLEVVFVGKTWLQPAAQSPIAIGVCLPMKIEPAEWIHFIISNAFEVFICKCSGDIFLTILYKDVLLLHTIVKP